MTPTDQKIQRVLNDPSTSNWLKNALGAQLQRDPVDAANDADVLAEIMREKLAEVFGAAGVTRKSNVRRKGRSKPSFCKNLLGIKHRPRVRRPSGVGALRILRKSVEVKYSKSSGESARLRIAQLPKSRQI
ncbi:Rossmann-fold NAD(P)-binding domain-containing protein [Ralstonia insidiosa]|jgi:hypothetical protein|nr:hypothetical protein [Ralstonia insidiosa]